MEKEGGRQNFSRRHYCRKGELEGTPKRMRELKLLTCTRKISLELSLRGRWQEVRGWVVLWWAKTAGHIDELSLIQLSEPTTWVTNHVFLTDLLIWVPSCFCGSLLEKYIKLWRYKRWEDESFPTCSKGWRYFKNPHHLPWGQSFGYSCGNDWRIRMSGYGYDFGGESFHQHLCQLWCTASSTFGLKSTESQNKHHEAQERYTHRSLNIPPEHQQNTQSLRSQCPQEGGYTIAKNAS